MKQLTYLILLIILTGCSGGRSSVSLTDPFATLEFEDYIMRGVADDINYMGSFKPLVYLDEIAAGLNFTAIERDEIPMTADCRFRIFTSQGATLEWFIGPLQTIHFTDDGRLSGGFHAGRIVSGESNGYFMDSRVQLIEENAFPIEVVLFTPINYGENIVVNVTTIAINETVTRIFQLDGCPV